MWFTGVEVEQETSVPPPKKNSGPPPCYNSTAETSLMTSVKNQPSGHFELVYFHSFGLFKLGNYAGAEEREPHPNSDKES